MTATATPDAAKAQARLDRLSTCPRIVPMQAGDEERRCLNCSFGVVYSGGWRHDPAEINRLRNAASEGTWPK